MYDIILKRVEHQLLDPCTVNMEAKFSKQPLFCALRQPQQAPLAACHCTCDFVQLQARVFIHRFFKMLQQIDRKLSYSVVKAGIAGFWLIITGFKE